jgi:nucleoside-diphosphate-sugar epimerase
MKRALLTGGSGFLGWYVREALSAKGRTTVELTRSAFDLEGDGTPSLDGSFDEIYHVAGLAHRVPRTDEERERFFRVNRDGTQRLLDAIDGCSRPPEAFVLVSTVAVYGVETGTGLDEATPRHAADPYGASKREAEDLVTGWCADRKIRCGIVRLPLVVGSGAPGNLLAMARAMQSGKYFGIGDGGARRSMVAASDVAAILPVVAERPGAYHLTDGRHPSFAEVEAAIARGLGIRNPMRIPFGIARTGARACDGLEAVLGRNLPFSSRVFTKMTSTLTFSDDRARKTLGWSPSAAVGHFGNLLDTRPC